MGAAMSDDFEPCCQECGCAVDEVERLTDELRQARALVEHLSDYLEERCDGWKVEKSHLGLKVAQFLAATADLAQD